MKIRSVPIFVFVLLSMVSSVYSAPYDNMLPTSGPYRRDFDEVGATWEKWGTGSAITNSTTYSRSGTRSCRLADLTQTVTVTSPADREIASATMTVVAGTKYCAAIWAYVPNEGAGTVDEVKIRLKIIWYDSSDYVVCSDTVTLITLSAYDTWQRIEISSKTAPANATQARFTIHAHESVNNNHDVYLDDGEFFSLPGPDTTPPGKVTGFTAEPGPSGGQIKLTWVAPGNDGYTGNLPSGSTFYIQYASWTGVNFSTTTQPPAGGYHIWIPTGPVTPGSTCTRVVTSLTSNVTYYFRIWARDNSGNWSTISDGATAYAKFVNSQPQVISYAHPFWGSGYKTKWLNINTIIFDWVFYDPDPGDTQSAFQIQIATAANFSTILYDSGKITSSNNYWTSSALSDLTWSSGYYWRIKVWDSYDLASSWVTYGETFKVDVTPPGNWSNFASQRQDSFWVGEGALNDNLTPSCRVQVMDVHSGLRKARWAHGIDGNVVGHWRLEPEEGNLPNSMYDESGNRNHGTGYNLAWIEDGGFDAYQGYLGEAGSGQWFWGTTSYISVPDSDSLDLTGNFTLEAWILPDEIGSRGTIISKEKEGGGGYYMYRDAGNKIRVGFNEGQAEVISNSQVPQGQWSYIAGVWNGTTMYIYINGLLDNTSYWASGNPNPGTNDQPLYFGRYWDNIDYKGGIDEVRISNCARSADDILLYYSTTTGAQYQYSTDGGVTWSSWTAASLEGNDGDTSAYIYASSVPFNQYSETLNKIRFRVMDIAGNIGTSGIYNVKIGAGGDSTPPAAISNLTALTGTSEGSILLKWTAPGNDGTANNLVDSLYRIRYTTSANITDFDSPPPSTYDWYVSTTNVVPGTRVSYVITGLTPGVTYYFAIKTRDDSNNWSSWSTDGVNTANFCEAMDIQPPAPTNLVTTSAGNSVVQLSWNAVDVSDLDYYELFCDSTTPYDWADQFIATTTKNTSFTHYGLTNDVTYYYRVRAVDLPPKVLYSNYSNEVSTFPRIILPAAPSINVDASGTTGTQIKWVLTDNAIDETNLYISSAPNTGARLWSSVGLAGSGGTTTWIETGFTSPNQSATRYGEARNAQGSSWSSAFTGYTRANAPINLTITSVSDEEVTLNWNPNGNPSNVRYELSYSKDNFAADFSTPITIGSNYTSSTATVGGLMSSTTYWFRVRAFNGNGIDTSFTAVKSTKTPANYILSENFDTDPYPPAGWVQVSVATSATYSQSSPRSVQFNANGDYLITPILSNPGILSYWMYATAGASNFIIEYSNSQDGPWTAFPWSPTTTDYGGTFKQETFDLSDYSNICIKFRRGNTKTYYLDTLRVTAKSVDTSPPSAISDLRALAGSTDGIINLRWSAPSDNNSSIKPFSGKYVIKYSSMQIINATDFDSPSFSHWTVQISTSGVAPGSEVGYDFTLTPGVTYYFAIKSTDTAGNVSVWNSSEDDPTVNTYAFGPAQDLVPPAPANLTTTPSDSSVLLTWDALSITDLDYYEVWCDSTVPYIFDDQFKITNTQNTSITHTGLTNHNTYYYRVRAVDTPPKVLTGDYSSVAYTYPRASAPLPPTLSYDPSGTTSSQIKWVITDNANNETGIYISSAANTGARLYSVGALAGIGGTATWSETGLPPNKSVTRYGEAVNTLGSSWSSPLTVYTCANPPATLDTTEVSYDGVYLTWSANGNPSGTRYELSYSNDNFVTNFSTPIKLSDNYTSTMAGVYGLNPDTVYYFRVRAFNDSDVPTSFSNVKSAKTSSTSGIQHLLNPSFEDATLGPWSNVVNLENETNPTKKIWQINNSYFTDQPDGSQHGFMEYGSGSTGWIGIAAEQTGLNVSGDTTKELTIKYYMRNQYNSWGSATGCGAIVEIEFESAGTKKLRIYHRRKYTTAEDNPTDSADIKYLQIPSGTSSDTIYCAYQAWGVEYSTGISSLIWDKFGINSFTVKAVRLGILTRGGPTTVRMAFDNVRLYSPPDTTPPSPISNLTALVTSSEGSIRLEWTSPGDDGESGALSGYYRIKYSTTSFASFGKTDPYDIQFSTDGVAPGTAVSYVVSGLKPGTSYYFAVIARDQAGNWSTWTKDLQTNTANFAWALDLPPSPPTSISATGLNRTVNISWQHPSPDPGDIDKYWVYQATFSFSAVTDGDVVNVATVSYPSSQATIGGLTNGTTYFYRIKAVDKGDTGDGYYGAALESPLSSIVSAVPKIRPPSNLFATHHGTYVTLTWNASPDGWPNGMPPAVADNFGGYNIYRLGVDVPGVIPDPNSGLYEFAGYTHGEITYDDTNIDKTKTYYYFIRSSDTAGPESDPSNVATAIPDLIPPEFTKVTELESRSLGKDIVSIEIKVTDDRFVKGDKQGKVKSVAGKYRKVNSSDEKDIKISPLPQGTYEFAGIGEIDLTVFVIGGDGIEYYLEASDEVNTTRWPSAGRWYQVKPPVDKPEQTFITPSNPELVFGKDVEEVIIRDAKGNEIWRQSSRAGNIIVWHGEGSDKKKVELGPYIYEMKTIDGKKKYGVVIIVK